MTDHVTDLDHLRDALREFAAARDWRRFHTPKNLAMAMIVEAAELVEHFQWLTPEQSVDLSAAKLADVRDEVGDWHIQALRPNDLLGGTFQLDREGAKAAVQTIADALGIDLIAAARDKMAKNAIKYPAETP